MNTKNGHAHRVGDRLNTRNPTRPPDSSRPELANRNSPGEPLEIRRAVRTSLFILLRRFVVPAAIATTVLSIMALGGLFSTPEPSTASPPRALEVVVVTAVAESGYEVQRSYLGSVESRRSSSLGFEMGGKLNSVFVDEGQPIEKGAILASLDTQVLKSNRNVIRARIDSAQAILDELIAGPRSEDIDSARAQVRRWQAQQKIAHITADRLAGLLRSNSVSHQEHDDAVYKRQSIQAQLDLAAAELTELENGTRKERIAAQTAIVTQLNGELKTIEINIDKSNLLAPYAGIISVRHMDEGEVIARGQAVFELLDNRQLEARIGLPVRLIESVAQIETHHLVYQNKNVAANLKSIRPEKNNDTRTVDVVYSLERSAHPASVGDIIRLELPETIIEPGFWIPTSASSFGQSFCSMEFRC